MGLDLDVQLYRRGCGGVLGGWQGWPAPCGERGRPLRGLV